MSRRVSKETPPFFATDMRAAASLSADFTPAFIPTVVSAKNSAMSLEFTSRISDMVRIVRV